MAAMEAANGHYHNGHHQQSGPLPASPTLTNPDMILPDYDRSESPDPGIDSRDHSSLMTWKSAQASVNGADMHHMFGATGPYGPTGPITPTTPIIYGNGTMLSDIGEVTEVESTTGKPSPSRSKRATRRPGSPTRGSGSDNTVLRSSPTIGAAATMKKKSKQSLKMTRDRRSSIDSNSTIKTEDQAGLFADFDDTVSVGDSVFQGDDEQSLASSYVEGTEAIEPARLGVAKIENVDRLSTYSATSLSRRAEEILANAKKRLSTMEGNLNRARSSLHYASPYGSEGSTPSPPPFQRAATAAYSRDSGVGSSASTPIHSPGHSRMASDVAMRNGLPYRVSLPRSQSALGAAGGYRQPLTASKSADHIQRELDDESARATHETNSVRESGLQPLTEDEVARLEEPDGATQSARLEAFLGPTFGSFSNEAGVRRSASAVQMRDIKDQMRDLKGKISSLREQARADSLKRRSLQSLRTPSPFTHAQVDQWYAEPRSNRTSAISTTSYSGRNPWNGEESSVDGDAKQDERQEEYAEDEDMSYATAETGTQLGLAESREPEPESPSMSAPVAENVNGAADEDVSDMLTEDGKMDEEQEQEDDYHDAGDADYQSESGESLYHDTVQHQISHEDREDAFDYEHFFLHSAMGTINQQQLARRGSTESFTSEDSVETTRGPVIAWTNGADHDSSPKPRSRRNSGDSVSTVETFATAQEGRSRKSMEITDAVSPGSDGMPESTPSTQSHRHRSGSTATAKRLSFSAFGGAHPSTSNGFITNMPRDSDGSISPIAEEGSGNRSFPQTRRSSVIHRPVSVSLHRPSVSSFDSVGTNRSFPLVNKLPNKAHSTGVLTPRESPDQDLRTITSRLLSDTLSAVVELQEQQRQQMQTAADDGGRGQTQTQTAHVLQALLREDKYLVERLVAGLGRCVLGLTENGRASAESRMFRRRLDAARRVLEGLDGAEGE
ncbi:hypothetical protein VTK56DRAFT_9615 [Thermocarpiscus australiensis]